MYDEQMEQLIDAALIDGVLTDKEKEILYRKAAEKGIDRDEFEMILAARVIAVSKKKVVETAANVIKTNKMGEVRKCPSCGAVVQSWQGTCSECGYAFENVEANRSYQRMAEGIDKIMSEFGFGVSEEMQKDRVRTFIKNFPVPSTKADLIEFITSLQTKISSGPYAAAYYAKYKECMTKAKLLFSDDPIIQKLIENETNKGALGRWWGNIDTSTKENIAQAPGNIVRKIVRWVAGIFGFTVILGMLSMCV